MYKTNWSKIFYHGGIILLFLLISIIYFSPILDGKTLQAHDSESWKYMAQEARNYNKTHDDVTLWTNSMFGGMPTYQITMPQNNNILSYVQELLSTLLSTPIFILFIYLTCFYFFLIIIGCNNWIAILGALFMSFASYNIIIIAAGHMTKSIVIAYMAPLIGSIWVAFRKDKIKGSILTLAFLSLAIRNNHFQIIYYTIIVLFIFGLVEFIYAIKEKQIKKFFQTVGFLCISAVIAIGMNATILLTTYEYSKYTMRGDSNGLTHKEQSSKPGGLDKDYITAWSYGIDETFTLLIPDFKGGASGGTLSADSETGKILKSMGVPNVEKTMKDFQLPLYWGTQPFTSGPVYLGAIVCFLFVIGLSLVDNRTKWWLIPTILLTLMLSWGRNFMPLTDFFIDYIPLYNKFRTVSMTLVATGFCMSLVAILGLKEFLKKDADKTKNKKALYIAAGVTGGLCLIFWLIPSLSGDFTSQSDSQFTGSYEFLKNTLPIDREELLRSDAIRSFIFIILAAGLLWIYNEKKLTIKPQYVCLILSILIVSDLYPVDKRYLNENNFEEKKRTSVQPSEADKFILKDKTYYRVLDASVNIFNDAKPAYFHKNIGGYHAAKLSRYQELIDYYLSKDIPNLFQGLNQAKTSNEQDSVLKNSSILNMLNTKYIIYNPKAAPIINPYANGNAWFVSSFQVAEDANQEMEMLGEINTKKELIIDKRYFSLLPDLNNRDQNANIELTSYAPNKLTYNYNSESDQLAVFSEIFYDKGWNAYIDGKKVPYFRANYLLRAIPLKVGNYTIEFRFEPQSFFIGNLIACICSILFILSIITYFIYKRKQTKNNLN